jgi:DNA-directed RNA polymerase specialized sigma24 family protein
MKTDSNSDGSGTKYGRFEMTQWSIVQSATDSDSPEARAALDSLCGVYWRPLYSFICRRGYKEQDAQDLTQAFFARLLEKNYLSAVDRRKGKFRSFLLTALDHFLLNEWRYTRAQKRGGSATFVSFDDVGGEGLANNIADAGQDAERIFEQQWAITMLQQVAVQLEQEFSNKHSPTLFHDIKPALICETSESSYKEIAAKHSTTEPAVKMLVSRLRKRFRQLLQAELENTVSTPEQLEEEMRALFAAFN